MTAKTLKSYLKGAEKRYTRTCIRALLMECEDYTIVEVGFFTTHDGRKVYTAHFAANVGGHYVSTNKDVASWELESELENIECLMVNGTHGNDNHLHRSANGFGFEVTYYCNR